MGERARMVPMVATIPMIPTISTISTISTVRRSPAGWRRRASSISLLVVALGACTASPSAEPPAPPAASAASAPTAMDAAVPPSTDGAEHATAEQRTETPIRLAPGLVVDRRRGEVRLSAQSALDAGWLEQAVCLAGTREHESLLVIDLPPRLVHAALLMLGATPGEPGRWRVDAEGRIVRDDPTGDRLEILLRFDHPRRGRVEEPLTAWIRVADGGTLPEEPWRFAGSRVLDGGGYAADYGGSVVGLATFGDEVVAFARVLADQAEVEAPQLLVEVDKVPPPGTPVEIVIRRAS